jgi:TBC1 domain family member 25
MSDLASPLLVTMGDEAHAYICLCALMTRLHPNFLLDGEAMTLKFSHLTESLQVYDPDFYNYLKLQQADDLLFCYRWLLLEMKREFAFDDALRMLEVLWASLPQKTPAAELSLKEKEFDPTIETDEDPPPLSPLVKAPRENAYTKVCAIRRQSSSFSLANVKAPKLATCKQMNHSLDENATRSVLSNSLKHSKEFQSMDDAALQLQKPKVEKHDNGLNVNKENNFASKDPKLHLRRSMKSVPEHCKSPDSQDTSSTWSSTDNLVNGNTHVDAKDIPLGNQIRLLRDKVTIHNNKFFTSLDDNTVLDSCNRPRVKMIKNLNEFLNFATSSKTGIRQDRLQRANSAKENKECPKIMLTKTSFDESDVKTHNFKDQKTKTGKNVYSDTNDGSSPDDSQEYYPMTTSMTRELRLELEHLDRQVFGQSYVNRCSLIYDSPSDSTSTDEKPTNCTEEKQTCLVDHIENPKETRETTEVIKKSPLFETIKSNARSAEDIYLWENPLHRNTPTTRTTASCPQTPDEQAELDFDGDTGEIFEEHSGKKSITPIRLLRKDQSLEPQDLFRETRSSNTQSSESDSSDKETAEPVNLKANPMDGTNTSRSQKFFSNMSQELENAKKNCESLLNAKQPNLHSVASTINNFQKKYEVFKPPVQKNVTSSVNSEPSAKFSITNLPPPTVFGGGNPFLMFLCLTVLLQHRDYIMRNRMDYNELAMHFDKMVRKHNVNRVLNQARQMYAIYLKQQAHKTGDVTT